MKFKVMFEEMGCLGDEVDEIIPVFRQNNKIIRVSDVTLHSEDMLYILIKGVHIDINKELGSEIPKGKTNIIFC